MLTNGPLLNLFLIGIEGGGGLVLLNKKLHTGDTKSSTKSDSINIAKKLNWGDLFFYISFFLVHFFNRRSNILFYFFLGGGSNVFF